MAEFSEVMKQWRRLCDSYVGCHKCPLEDFKVDSFCCRYVHSSSAKNAKWDEIADIIMKWAEEHPEPRFPTWYEFLYDIFDPGYTTDEETFYNWLYDTPIQDNLAEMLGISPNVQ